MASPTKTACNHYFCHECLKTWLGSAHTCPTCRSELFRLTRRRIGIDGAFLEQLRQENTALQHHFHTLRSPPPNASAGWFADMDRRLDDLLDSMDRRRQGMYGTVSNTPRLNVEDGPQDDNAPTTPAAADQSTRDFPRPRSGALERADAVLRAAELARQRWNFAESSMPSRSRQAGENVPQRENAQISATADQTAQAFLNHGRIASRAERTDRPARVVLPPRERALLPSERPFWRRAPAHSRIITNPFAAAAPATRRTVSPDVMGEGLQTMPGLQLGGPESRNPRRAELRTLPIPRRGISPPDWLRDGE